MRDTTKEDAQTALELRSILQFGRQHGARSVTFRNGTVSVIEQTGREVAPISSGTPLKIDIDRLGEILMEWGNHPMDEDVIDNIAWKITYSEDGISLKPKKAFAAILDRVAAFDEDDLASLRSLYGVQDIRIVCYVEGDTRQRDLAYAMATERLMADLPTRTAIDHPSSRHWNAAQPPDLADIDQPPGPSWTIAIRKKAGHTSKPAEAGAVQAEVSGGRIPFRHTLETFREQADDGKPTVVIAVELEKSAPVGRIYFSPTARRMAAPDKAKDPSLPWNFIAKTLDARRSSKPAKPKTWLPTTEAVAESFVTGAAPRGYVSGKSLYFHGPVAFSGADRNPCCALVNDLEGNPVLIFGRTWQGDAVTSMAQSDIVQAYRSAGIDIDRITIGPLADAVVFDGTKAANVPWRFKKAKNEADFARTATLDQEPIVAWLSEEESKGRAEIAEAHSDRAAKYATNRKVNSFENVARLHDLAMTLNKRFGLSCPGIADIDDIRAGLSEAKQALNRRHAERNAGAEAAAAP